MYIGQKKKVKQTLGQKLGGSILALGSKALQTAITTAIMKRLTG